MSIPVVTFIGKSGAGKTTLLEQVIRALTEKGWRVGTIKHHSHTGFEIDHPGKDSFRFAEAGSRHVIIASPGKVASYWLVEATPPFADVVASITDVDIILVEGYRNAGMPCIEVIRQANSTERIADPDLLFAVAADFETGDDHLPRFALGDTDGVTALIEERFLKNS